MYINIFNLLHIKSIIIDFADKSKIMWLCDNITHPLIFIYYFKWAKNNNFMLFHPYSSLIAHTAMLWRSYLILTAKQPINMVSNYN